MTLDDEARRALEWDDVELLRRLARGRPADVEVVAAGRPRIFLASEMRMVPTVTVRVVVGTWEDAGFPEGVSRPGIQAFSFTAGTAVAVVSDQLSVSA